jgi:hypothetical protein
MKLEYVMELKGMCEKSKVKKISRQPSPIEII